MGLKMAATRGVLEIGSAEPRVPRLPRAWRNREPTTICYETPRPGHLVRVAAELRAATRSRSSSCKLGLGGGGVSEENQSGHPDPYAPPESELEASLESVLPSARRAGFATHALLVQAITGLLGVQAILHAINAVVCLLLASGMSEVAGAIELVPVSRALAGAQPFFYLMGIIPFALFLYGANKNARQFELAAGASDDAEQGAV